MRKRVPDANYHRGCEVVDATSDDRGRVALQFTSGPSETFDLVLLADGYQSLGRRLLFPSTDLTYRGYVSWRGLLPEEEMADSAILGSTMPRPSYAELDGNCVMYLAPGPHGSTAPGHRICNWAAYIPTEEAVLADFMIDRDGAAHSGTIPPGKMRLEEEGRLKQLMCDNLPTYYGDIVAATRNTYAQLIYAASVPAYSRDRLCLIGDAGMVVQPFTGSGVFKSCSNVKDLLLALDSHRTIGEALQHWGPQQVERGNRLLALGEQMEQAFIWKSTWPRPTRQAPRRCGNKP